MSRFDGDIGKNTLTMAAARGEVCDCGTLNDEGSKHDQADRFSENYRSIFPVLSCTSVKFREALPTDG